MAATWKSEYFYGNKISDYGLQQGYVDYRTLSKCFDMVICNIDKYWDSMEQVGGFYDDEIEELEEQMEELEEHLEDLQTLQEETDDETEFAKLEGEIQETILQIADLQYSIDEINDYYPEIYQYFIVSDNAVDILALNNEFVYYIRDLEVYVWGVTHLGTSWDYVLTDIKIELDE